MVVRRHQTVGPTRIAVVHNNVDQRSSIGKLAMWATETALAADMEVVVVARDLDRSLCSSVDWRHLYVPPRVHAFQWAVARKTIQFALRGANVDLIHVYQPQVASLADTWHVAFLSRVGRLNVTHQARTLHDVQQAAVAAMEDRYLRALSDRPTVLFPSEMLASQFRALYGEPAQSGLLYNPAPPGKLASAGERSAARRHHQLTGDAFVIGFLGGLDARKGYEVVADAVADIPDGLLVLAGPGSTNHVDARLGDRLQAWGMLADLDEFWACIDVLAVPSRFDPFAMVVTEAASHGIPSVVTPAVGIGTPLASAGAGLICDPAEFRDGLLSVRQARDEFGRHAQEFAAELSEGQLGKRLLAYWEAALTRAGD